MPIRKRKLGSIDYLCHFCLATGTTLLPLGGTLYREPKQHECGLGDTAEQAVQAGVAVSGPVTTCNPWDQNSDLAEQAGLPAAVQFMIYRAIA